MWHIKLSHKSDSTDLIVVVFMPSNTDSNICHNFGKKIELILPLIIGPQFYKTHSF